MQEYVGGKSRGKKIYICYALFKREVRANNLFSSCGKVKTPDTQEANMKIISELESYWTPRYTMIAGKCNSQNEFSHGARLMRHRLNFLTV